MDKIKVFFRKNWLTSIGTIAGAIGGYLYWYNVGCLTGTCPIKASPYLMVGYGILLGSLVFSIFQKIINTRGND